MTQEQAQQLLEVAAGIKSTLAWTAVAIWAGLFWK